MSLSVLILTLNEEENLPTCLQSLQWCDDIVVLDSFSSDRTVDIAADAGARVIQRRFDSWDAHQNWAMEHITFKYPWVYYSDADETVPPDLRDEMRAVVRDPRVGHAAYRLRYKNFFCNRWIRHCGIYPVWVLRLFRPQAVRWERLVNPVPIVRGSIGELNGHFHHYSFRKGYEAWFHKHNKYSSQEALEGMKIEDRGVRDWSGIFSLKDASRRRRAMKELSFRLPCRPLFRFLYMYVVRLGLLDGIAGFRYCRLLAIYEYMIVLKTQEYAQRERGLSL
ncbi:MAG TPA: glycosyltransferase family 2 protein [Nitrospira sp.]|nr:glycosyltransferase family 2 protein [Nitrospira sp.]